MSNKIRQQQNGKNITAGTEFAGKQTTSYMKNKIMLPLLQLKKLQTSKINERIWWC